MSEPSRRLAPKQRWNPLKVATIGAVIGPIYGFGKMLSEGRNVLDLGTIIGGLIGGVIAGAVMFGLVAIVRNMLVRAK